MRNKSRKKWIHEWLLNFQFEIACAHVEDSPVTSPVWSNQNEYFAFRSTSDGRLLANKQRNHSVVTRDTSNSILSKWAANLQNGQKPKSTLYTLVDFQANSDKLHTAGVKSLQLKKKSKDLENGRFSIEEEDAALEKYSQIGRNWTEKRMKCN